MPDLPSQDLIEPAHLAVLWLLRFHRIAIEPERLLHALGAAPTSVSLLRYLRACGLRARATWVRPQRLALTPMPAIALFTDGTMDRLAHSRHASRRPEPGWRAI